MSFDTSHLFSQVVASSPYVRPLVKKNGSNAGKGEIKVSLEHDHVHVTNGCWTGFMYSLAVCDLANILVGAGGCNFPCNNIYAF